MLPSLQISKRKRTKSLKQRHQDLQDEHVNENRQKPKSLQERYSELKESTNVTAGNLASLVRDSTLSRMQRLGTDNKTFNKTRRQLKNVFHDLTLWSGTFKEVEGHFGTAVMTYFRFIKWLMYINIYMMVITFCVITVPFLALGPYQFEESINSSMPGYKEVLNCSKEYVVFHDNVVTNRSTEELVLDFFLGTGWMERTVLFYGVYFNKTYPNPSNTDDTLTYNMSLAYLLAVGISFLICFVLIVKNSAKNVKVTLGMEQSYAKYSNKVFSGWDFCICRKRTATIKHKSFKKDISADLLEERIKMKWESKSTIKRCRIYFIRVTINLLVLIMLGGALYLIAFTAQKMIDLENQQLEEFVTLIVQYVPYITITALNLILPLIFQKLVTFEKYKHSTEIALTLARSILLRLASPLVLIAILYLQLIETSSSETRTTCGNKRWDAAGTGLKGSVKCWESYFGQQIYKLVLLDLFVETGIILFVQLPRSIMHRRYGSSTWLFKIVGPQPFDLPQSVVDIIYSQNICWLGLFFSPIIPFMTFLKCFIFFYVKKYTVLYVCQPEERPFRTSRSNSLFMTVLLVAFIFAAVPIGYMIGNLPPSQSCGPFRSYSSNINGTEYVMFDTITNTIYSWPQIPQDIFYFLGTVGFFIPVIIIILLLMYYYWLLGQGYKKTEKLLQEKLKLEGRDKRYLLLRLNELMSHIENQKKQDADNVFTQAAIS